MQAQPLTELQLELLALYGDHIPEEQLREIKGMLARYFAEKAISEMDRLLDDQQIDVTEWTDKMLGQHLRTSYKQPDR